MLRIAVLQNSRSAASNFTSRGLRSTARNHALSKFTMPAMSPTMTEGGLTSWKKKAGDSFAPGDVLLEIETDKATMDVEAQEEGIMAKIIVEDGTKAVPVGKVIAIMGEEGDDISGSEVDKLVKEAESESPAQDSGPEKAAEPKEDEKPQEKSAEKKPDEPSDKSESPSSSTPKKPPKQEEEPSKPRSHIFASPIARRLASEKGLPLQDIKGTGPNGRIVKADIDNYKPPSGKSATSAPASTSTPSSPATSASLYTDIPVSSMRKTIAKRLTESKQNVPHYYVTGELNVDRLFQLRQVFNTAAAKSTADQGAKASAKLSVNDFFIKAAALALMEVPEANSAWLGDSIRQYHTADISMAVATPTGLITPIISDAARKGLATISTQAKALAQKARDGKLKPEEYQGGTFTISNLGMFGSVNNFSAIINSPQSCILAIGGPEDKLVVDADSEKGFKAIKVVKVTLSADHRVVDGAVGAKWMKAFKDLVENPLTFLL